MKVWTEPKVTCLTPRLEFQEPEHLPVEWGSEEASLPIDEYAELVEYAGRLCYMSQANPARRTTAEYVENLLRQGHGSVLEHATFTLLLEGISRSLSHELVRHRAGCSYSQLSQRYVESVDVVVPPAILEQGGREQETWQAAAEDAVHAYQNCLDRLQLAGVRGKRAKEAARSLLPNAAETKVVMTANARAWRHVVELRSAEGADSEMRRLMRAVLGVLQQASPVLFGDFDAEGTPMWSKV